MFKDKVKTIMSDKGEQVVTITLMPFWKVWVLHVLGRCYWNCGICYEQACRAYKKHPKEKRSMGRGYEKRPQEKRGFRH